MPDDGIKSKLSVHSSGMDKSNEKINIFIKKCKNLTTQKAEGLTIYAKIDFNEIQIAESHKIQIGSEGVPDFNFSTQLNVATTDQNSLDEIAYKPVIITLIEVLPKEKKQKEDKFQTFGQAVFDLFQILRGDTNVSFKLPVYSTPGSTLESQPADVPLPELEVHVTIDQPILTDEEFSKCNLLTITLESMCALPESWNSSNNMKEYAYTVSLPIPINDDKDNAVTFVNGLYKAPTDSVNKLKRWNDTRGIQAANALYIPNSTQVEDSSAEEFGDFISKEDKEYRTVSEKDKPKIYWNTERRCFLNQTSNNALREQLLKTRYWPIEVIRTFVPTGVKGKRDEDLSMSYHGVAYVDMAHLLYPGATQIKGAFKILPYSDAEYTNKTKRKPGFVDESLKVLNYLYDRNFAILPAKKDQKTAEKKDAKKNPRESIAEGHDISQSVQQILDSKSFLVIDIKFDKPLIPRKPFDVLVKKVSELIPPRPKYPVRSNGAEKAISDYHGQIKTIINSILEDYRNLSQDENDFIEADYVKKESDLDQRRRKLLYELNSTGKYFAFKEQLKNSVIKIVREKFLKTSAFNDPEELQQFLAELYVFLTDELHKCLNETLTIEDLPSVENNLSDNQQMKHFALEAEMNRNFDLAAYYYQERIASEKENYQNWLDYAVFNLLVDDYTRSEECLKECISINQNENTGLLLYSVICSMQEKYDLAETFLERVIVQDNENIVAWTLYAILYEQKGQDLNAEITYKKALKLNQAISNESNATNLNLSVNQNPSEGDPETKREEELEDDAMSKAQISDVGSRRTSKIRGNLTQSTKIKLDNISAKVPKSPGLNNKTTEMSIMHTGKDKSNSDSLSNKSIFMKTAQFLIKYNVFSWAEKCMAKELINSNGGGNCTYHLLLTKIKMAKNQLEDAEKHCVEALSHDYQNCEAWIQWSHITYLIGDFKNAKERYERVLLFSELPVDQTHSIYIRLASIYLKEENYEDSKRLFLHPCKTSPSCMSWLGVGICCYRLYQLEEAKNALCEANILNNKAPEVWAYLSLVCLSTNKPLEAEQAYKYAIKLNLDNPELLEEIHALQEKVGFGNPEF